MMLTGPVSQDLYGVAREFSEAFRRRANQIPTP